MIRIDLGRSEKKKSGQDISELLNKVKAHIPKNLKVQSKGQKRDWGQVVAIAIATAVALLPYLFVSQYKSYVKSQHEMQMQQYAERENQLNAEIARYQSFQRELESYEKQKRLINERLQVVRRLLEARNTPVNALDALAQSLPEKTWLNSIEFKTSPTPGIQVAGLAYSNDDISDYVDKLSESIQLKDVSLEAVSSSRTDKDFEAKQFSVMALPAGEVAVTIDTSRDTAGQKDKPVEVKPDKDLGHGK